MVAIPEKCNIMYLYQLKGESMEKMKQWLRRFMTGRYGTDKLNMTILTIGVIASVASMFVPIPMVQMLLTFGAYALMIWALYRMLSRQTYKRYQENRKFLQFFERIRDREHRYYDCPRCRQQIRVPRGKGKISITCPKCKEKFIKKT